MVEQGERKKEYLGDSLAKGILNGSDGDESKITSKVVPDYFAGLVLLRSERRPARKVARAKRDRAKTLLDG